MTEPVEEVIGGPGGASGSGCTPAPAPSPEPSADQASYNIQNFAYSKIDLEIQF